MAEQVVVARRIQVNRAGHPLPVSPHVGIDDVFHQQHDRLGVGDRMEIGDAERTGISFRSDKEPERIETRLLNEGGVQLVLDFSVERGSRGFSAIDVFDVTDRRAAVIVITPPGPVQRQVGESMPLQCAVDNGSETPQIESVRNSHDVNRVVGVQVVPLKHGSLENVQPGRHDFGM